MLKKMDLFVIMKKNYINLFLLLVTISFINAHADNQYKNKNNNTYTITLPSFKQNASALTPDLTKDEYNKYNIESNDESYIKKKEDLLKQNNEIYASDDSKTDYIPKAYSVVQDWLLVCKQLCGAGLGGPTCGTEPACNEIKEEASQKYNITAKAKQLLEDNIEPICQDLCKYQLGDEICACGQRIVQISDYDSNDIEETDNNLWGRNQICHTFCKHNDITITGCSICSKDVNESTKRNDNDTKITATTPDWEEICKKLCKSGDGGSLCNCDKPPFF